MRLYTRKGSAIWYASFIGPNGKRTRLSSGTSDKAAAQEWAAKAAHDAWRSRKLGEAPAITWDHAVLEWLKEHGRARRSIETIKTRLRWLTKHLTGTPVRDINRDKVRELKRLRMAEPITAGGRSLNRRCTPSTCNRMLAELSKILNYCAANEWIPRAPAIDWCDEDDGDPRWITQEEADRLLAELPPHLAAMARFALATGLRTANVTGLRWRQVDLVRKCAWVASSDAKAGKAIPVPLNEDALEVLAEQDGRHPEWVFVYKGHQKTAELDRLHGNLSTAAWHKACARAGIEDFTFHDLRHTWASWHVMNETPLIVLQQLGGWADYKMVLRYAHLAPGFVADYAGNATRHKNGTVHTSAQNEKRPQNQQDADSTGVMSGVADGIRTHDNWNHNIPGGSQGNVSALIYLASRKKRAA